MRYIIIAVLGFCYSISFSAGIIVKASIMRGETFVTAKTNFKEIEDRARAILNKKGFELVDHSSDSKNVLFLDLFIYQFFGQYPAATLTVRSVDGIHYVDRDFKKAFVDRDQSNFNLAEELIDRLPNEINLSKVYRLSLGDLLMPNKVSSTGLVPTLNSKYYSTINWEGDKEIAFILPNELRLFLLYASNFAGLKKQLARGPIVLKLKINNASRFELVTINSDSNLDEIQKARILEFVESFPLWLTDKEVENIEIQYGLH